MFTPMLIHIPHASVFLPPAERAAVLRRRYGRDRAVQSVMVEVNRRLYLTPDGRKSAGFAQTRQTVAALLRELEADLRGRCVPR